MTTKQYNSAKNSRIVAIVASAAALIFTVAAIFIDSKPTLSNCSLLVIIAAGLINAIIHKPIPPQDTQN